MLAYAPGAGIVPAPSPPRIDDMPVDDVTALAAAHAVPRRAWRAAGLEPDAFVTTLADCSVPQLEAFALMPVETADGIAFRSRAWTCLVALYRAAGEAVPEYHPPQPARIQAPLVASADPRPGPVLTIGKQARRLPARVVP